LPLSSLFSWASPFFTIDISEIERKGYVYVRNSEYAAKLYGSDHCDVVRLNIVDKFVALD
jgi:hypothetical protein